MPETAMLLAVSGGAHGLGGPLRIVLLISVVGVVFLAWILLRGYRDGGKNE